MRNAIILLSVLLAVAIITILVLSWRYINTKDVLLINEKTISELNEEIIQLKQKSSELNDQVRENIKYFNELKIAKNRLSELETELSSKKTMVTELQERLKSSQSRFTQLEDEIIKHKSEIDSLQSRLSNFERQSVESEAQTDKMRSTYETTISGLNKKIQSGDKTIAEFQERFKEFEFEISSLKNEIKKCKDENKELFLRISEFQGEKGQLKIKMEKFQSTHNAIVSELKNQIQNKEVTIRELEDKLSITFVDRVLFQFGKATITREGEELLTKVGNILKNVQDGRIRVIGHTDNIPIMDEYRYKFPSNWELSTARAASVVRYLHEEIGLNPKTLEAVGRSFYEPIASNETDKGRAKNRRVEIIIAPRRN